MGQIYSSSTIAALAGVVAGRIADFNSVLPQQKTRPVELVEACQALEADIVCRVAFPCRWKWI
jgi:hypothetical protein